MLSMKDQRLLEKATPTLTKCIDTEGSNVLGQLLRRGALRQKQIQIINVCMISKTLL